MVPMFVLMTATSFFCDVSTLVSFLGAAGGAVGVLWASWPKTRAAAGARHASRETASKAGRPRWVDVVIVVPP